MKKARATPFEPASGDEPKLWDTLIACIVHQIRPASVLVADLGNGQLLAGLRHHHLNAFGLAPSQEAVHRLPEELRDYCQVGTLAQPLTRRFDLIVCDVASLAEAEGLVVNLCRETDEVLLFAERRGAAEDWAEQFARQSFVRETVCFDAPSNKAAHFRRAPDVIGALASRELLLARENEELHRINTEMRQQTAARTQDLREARAVLDQLRDMKASVGWRASHTTWRLLRRLAPEKTLRGRVLELVQRNLLRVAIAYELFFDFALRYGFGAALRRTGEVFSLTWMERQLRLLARFRHRKSSSFALRELETPRPLEPHTAPTSIVICVHDALEDVRRCVESVVRFTRAPYQLVLVDDGSGSETRDFLACWAEQQDAALLRNDAAFGYTRAANQGLRASTGDYVILLNSDTVVTPDWLDRLITCAESDEQIGLVGPLSNTASWQSIPELLTAGGDWADNSLPEGVSPEGFALAVAAASGRLYPRVAFLNGFCLLIKRPLMEAIGVFDEAEFGPGYGEENDYCARAQKAGWQLAVADDVYIFHAQSRSYSHDRRRQLSEQAHLKLTAKHGERFVDAGVQATRDNRVLEGIRARARVMWERQRLVEAGRARWEGRRVLFLLPVREGGGGANVVFQEAAAMQRMGVQVDVLNLNECRVIFEQQHPRLPMRVIYVDQPREVAPLLPHYDAVIATYNRSVAWMELPASAAQPVRAYYIQDFEPFFYSPRSTDYERALQSYDLFPDLIRITKTAWNRAAVKQYAGVESVVVGPSVAVDLFRPRRTHSPAWPARPLRIAAMIRPSSPRRAPRLTMEVLGEVRRAHGASVEVVLFGSDSDDPAFLALPRRFPWRNAGSIRPEQLASLLNDVDIFVDFSTFQAMGLTAMEAMACGAAVIVPQRGGADSFAQHEQNCLIVDTESRTGCRAALERLIRDERLRQAVSRQALQDVAQFYPERAAHHLLAALFPSRD